ncbi:MAG TPA: hypothetical protein VGQ51_06020 [Puia sp.]|jgi:ketosteroid isomerase-like protein|nr:hypothetical protein [Puia sp.]
MKHAAAILGVLVFLSACTSNPTPSTTDSSKIVSDSSLTRPIQSPFDITYSSKFAMDEPTNAESVLKFWKAYDNGDFSTVKNLFADSFEVHLADGMSMHTSRDSTLADVTMFRNSLTASSSTVTAVMAVKSTDRDEHWVLIWGTEKDTHKDGKIDSVDLHEAWQFNKNGQAMMLLQYKRSYAPPAAMKKKK